MAKHVALLRGINVSGKNKILMLELKSLFENLGYSGVTTYLQSGNIVFDTKSNAIPGKEASRISKAIMKTFGYEVPVLVVNASYLATTLKENPFGGSDTPDFNSVYVTFLFSEPEKAYQESLVVPNNESGLFKIIEHKVYVHCPDGYGKTKINNQYFETKLRVGATTRNWKTVRALEGLSSSD